MKITFTAAVSVFFLLFTSTSSTAFAQDRVQNQKTLETLAHLGFTFEDALPLANGTTTLVTGHNVKNMDETMNGRKFESYAEAKASLDRFLDHAKEEIAYYEASQNGKPATLNIKEGPEGKSKCFVKKTQTPAYTKGKDLSVYIEYGTGLSDTKPVRAYSAQIISNLDPTTRAGTHQWVVKLTYTINVDTVEGLYAYDYDKILDGRDLVCP